MRAGLVGEQRQREEALSRYAYDVVELRERLDEQGSARRRREDERTRELAEAIRDGRTISEKPGVRLSRILERYDFDRAGRETIEGRCGLVFDFAARRGEVDRDRDTLWRKLVGRLWVDEEERAVVRLEARNTSGLRFALGLGAAVSAVSFEMSFTRVERGVWLPRRLEAYAEGRRFPFRSFRTRRTATYSNYRRFDVDTEERIRPEERGRPGSRETAGIPQVDGSPVLSCV